MTRRFASLLVLVLIIALLGAAIAQGVGATRSGETAATSLEWGGQSYDGRTLQDGGRKQVAIVPVYGVITSGRTAASGATVGGDDLVGVIRAIRESDDYDAILLEIDTPGGGVLPSSEVANEIRLAKKDGIKVVAWMRDVAASGGYYIAAGADRIVAADSTITGSIGVIFEYVQVAGLADKIGVAPVIVKSGALKDMGSPYRDLTPEERTVLQTMIDEAYNGFVTVVSEGRDMTPEAVKELADGRIYTGLQAKGNGLVDEIGLRDEAYRITADEVKAASADDLTIIEFSPSFSFFEMLAAGASKVSPTAKAGVAGQVFDLMTGGGSASVGAAVRDGASSRSSSPLRLEYRMVP